MLIPVKGYAIPRGVLLDGEPGASDLVYVTKDFFDNSAIRIPAQARPMKLWTYRYYKPDSRNPKAQRGSGRDYFIAADSDDPARRLVSVKGAGTNSLFSAVNGYFNLSDFRTNGLQNAADTPDGEHGGGVEEYIVAKNLADAGVPVLSHERLVLLPETLQSKIIYDEQPNNLAVQVDRVQEDARESYYEQPPTKEDRVKLAGALYFYNIGHGAVNPENITGNAKLADIGHVTFGYPFLSGIYRCTICKGMHGSNFELTGILDHYFPKASARNFDDPAHRHDLSEPEFMDLVRGMLLHINSSELHTALTDVETRALLQATQEELGVKQLRNYTFAERDQPALWRFIVSQQAALLGVSEKQWHGQDYIPMQPSVSLRLVMQVVALKWLLGPEAEAKAREALLSFGKSEVRLHITALFDLFDRLFTGKQVTPEQLRKTLFREYMPAGEIQHALYTELQKARDKDGKMDFLRAADILREQVRRFRKPVEVEPAKLLDILLNVESYIRTSENEAIRRAAYLRNPAATAGVPHVDR